MQAAGCFQGGLVGSGWVGGGGVGVYLTLTG